MSGAVVSFPAPLLCHVVLLACRDAAAPVRVHDTVLRSCRLIVAIRRYIYAAAEVARSTYSSWRDAEPEDRKVLLKQEVSP